MFVRPRPVRSPASRLARAVGMVEVLEDRRLLSVSLAAPVSIPLSSVPGGDPAAPVVADFDGDGELDVVVAYPSPTAIDAGYVQFGKGDGSGTFALSPAVDVGIFTGRPVVGDFDGDGALDLAVTNAFDAQVKVLTGNGDGAFAAAQPFSAGVSPEALAVADFDGDGLDDLVVGNRSSNTVQVRLGDAATTLGAATTIATATDPASVAAGDFTNDGELDILVGASGGVGASSGVLQVFAGNGDGTFSNAALDTLGPRGVTAVADLDGDQGPDAVVGVTDRDRADALLNKGNGTFTLTPGSTGAAATKAAVAADMDGNGTTDLVTAVAGQIDVLSGNGDGTFAPAEAFNAAGGSGPAVADLLGDDRPDVLTITATPGQTAGRTLNVSLGQRNGPDFTIENLSALPPAVVGGAKGQITVRVTNNGNENFKGAVPLQVYASTDTTVDDGSDSLLIQTNKKLNLKAGKSKNVKLKFDFVAPPETYNIITRVDPAGTTADLNLLDNSAIVSTPVTVADPFVDLSALMPASPAGPVSAGDKLKVDLQVTNQGNVKAVGRVAMLLTASTDAFDDGADLVLKSLSPNVKLKPGQTKSYKFKLKLGDLPAGTYNLLGVVDVGSSFVDADDTNDVAVGPTPLTVA